LKLRVDASEEIGDPTETEEGYLVVPAVAATTGILKYREAKGDIRRELVTAEALRSRVESIIGKPVTLGHPEEGEVNPDNFKREVVGHVAAATFDEDTGELRVKLRINDSEAIRRVRSGTRELSPGYDVDLEHEEGEHDEHGEYDVVQGERIYNHLALTDEARDSDAAITRLDSRGHVMALRNDQDQGQGKGHGPGGQGKGEGQSSSAPEGSPPDKDGGEKDERSSEQMLSDIETKLDRLTSSVQDLVKTLKPDDAGEGDEDSEMSGEGEGTSETRQDRLDWLRRREDAIEDAKSVGADIDPDEDTIEDIKRAAVEAKTGTRLDSNDDVEVAYKLAFGRTEAEDDETRQDTGDWSFGPDAFTPGDDETFEFDDDEDERGMTSSKSTFRDNLTGND